MDVKQCIRDMYLKIVLTFNRKRQEQQQRSKGRHNSCFDKNDLNFFVSLLLWILQFQ